MTNAEPVPFNRPYYTGDEQERILEAIAAGHLSSNGAFTALCEQELQDQLGAERVLLTPSGTAALELAAILLDIGPGDEVIMPSYTFTSTANAFALRGGVPVFVDIREDTLNLDETQVEAAITSRTRALVPVHYAGVGCEMDDLCAIADRHRVAIVEDAAHGLMASHRGRPLGGMGRLGTISFHETKNLSCGEGGALVINDPQLVARAEVIRDKGTDRSAFLRGEVDKYTWVDLGSSFGLSELNAAFLWAQFGHASTITSTRLEIWGRYNCAFAQFERCGWLRRPVIPAHVCHNAHMYYLLLPTSELRDAFLRELRGRGIDAVFHFVPLDSSTAGRRLGRTAGPLPWTHHQSSRLVRLPLWAGMTEDDVERVISSVAETLTKLFRAGSDAHLRPLTKAAGW